MGWQAISVVAALCLGASCSVLFEGKGDPGATDSDAGDLDAEPGTSSEPLYRYSFEDNGAAVLTSSGTSPLQLAVQGAAVVGSGYLFLNDNDNVIPDRAESLGDAGDANLECSEKMAVTIAAWVTVAPQEGTAKYPRRIFGIENTPLGSNFALAQGQSSSTDHKLIVRVGERMEIVISDNIFGRGGGPLWVFFTMGEGGDYTFQIGDDPTTSTTDIGSGALWVWAPDYSLTLGNSNSTLDEHKRPWKGRLHHVEFYCRKLGEDEMVALKASTDPSSRQ